MPKVARELTALAVGKLKEDGRYAVGGATGLKLRIDGGSRRWVLRVVVAGKRRDMGLGSYPELSLADARARALQHRKTVTEGRNPIDERRAQKAREAQAAAHKSTFAECAGAYVEAHRSGWKSAKHAAQWTATLETYAFPAFGTTPVADIDTALVLKVLEPIWTTKTETASRVRGRIESVLDWATVRGYRAGENPARWKGHLRHQLPARSKVQKVEHHAALAYHDISHFMMELRSRDGLAARALEFSILTAARSGEVRGSVWNEIDLDAAVWTIPAARMKAGKEHRVPLSTTAVALLKALPRADGCELLFPSPHGRELSDMAFSAVLERMGHSSITQHGTARSTFRDWAAEVASFPREVVEHALAHKLKDKAEAAYQRGDLLEKRRKLMEQWCDYCGDMKTGVVLPFVREQA